MKYKNRRTGAVVNTSGKISGGDWEEIPVAPAQPKKEPADTDKKETAPTVKKTTTKTTAKKTVMKKTTGRK